MTKAQLVPPEYSLLANFEIDKDRAEFLVRCPYQYRLYSTVSRNCSVCMGSRLFVPENTTSKEARSAWEISMKTVLFP
jgi:hypothetical protein